MKRTTVMRIVGTACLLAGVIILGADIPQKFGIFWRGAAISALGFGIGFLMGSFHRD